MCVVSAFSSRARWLNRAIFRFKLLSSSIDGAARALRVVDVITIPPIDGNVKIVVYAHPRDNMLSHYVSQRERQCFLIPETEEGRERASQEDVMGSTKESKLPDMPPSVPQPRTTEETEGRNIDLSSFIQCAASIQCLASSTWLTASSVLPCKRFNVLRSCTLHTAPTATSDHPPFTGRHQMTWLDSPTSAPAPCT
jgi:hypothetical protein